MAEAALVLGVTERQSYRIKARIREEGVKGVIHGNRGRRCAWKVSEKAERKIVEAARGKYRGFNDHHLTESLKKKGSSYRGRRCVGSLGLRGSALLESAARPSIGAEG